MRKAVEHHIRVLVHWHGRTRRKKKINKIMKCPSFKLPSAEGVSEWKGRHTHTHKKKGEVRVAAAVEKISSGSFKSIVVDLLVCLELADFNCHGLPD